MKQNWLWVAMAALGLWLSLVPLPAEDLEAGRAALFLQGGKMVVGEVVDISRTRLVVQLRDGQEFPFHRVWMINFVNTDWNFPEERERLEKDEHYIFFRNDRMTSGQIIDFSSTRKVFELDTEEEVPIARVRRVYFTNRLPAAYESRLAEEAKPNYVGVYRTELPASPGMTRTITLTLNEDKTATLQRVHSRARLPVNEQGTWAENPDGTITVRTVRLGQIRPAETTPLVFRLENDELVAVQFDPNVWGSGGLRLKRT
jgi:hypothetical protein